MAAVKVEFTDAGATVSECSRYRYDLWRKWNQSLPTLGFCMCNPSTADANQLDPTIRRCLGFAITFGFGGLVVTNLFALRSTDPGALYPDPAGAIGPANDEVIISWMKAVPATIIAWGTHGALGGRAIYMLRMMHDNRVHPWCLKRTQDGHPGHPLYLSSQSKPFLFDQRSEEYLGSMEWPYRLDRPPIPGKKNE